jgi:monoamine oxidase
MATSDYDTIVIGGGFSGVAAARELAHAGQRVLLLEGRDRLGGRTWYKEDVIDGRSFEMGGTWVHWVQPHVFAEITRYGLELIESPGAAAPETVAWITGGQRKVAAYDEAWPMIQDCMERFCSDARIILERPYEPLSHEAMAEADRLSVQDRIDALGLGDEQTDVLSALWSLCASAKCTEAGFISMLRWYALAGWDIGLVFDAATRYKFKKGTRSLIEAMAADSAAEIRFSTPVEAVEQDADGVVVTSRDGEAFRARAAVVTVPLNTLNSIQFTPALSREHQAAADAGQASHGSKLWVRVRGDLKKPLFAMAPDDHPLQYLQTEVILDDGQILVGFGWDAASLDVTSVDAVREPVRALLGDVEIVEANGHDWLDDEFARGTWPVLRPGQMTKSLTVLQQSEGNVFFAGSETANGWNGFIDGAIESGLRAAREVKAALGTAPVAAAATAA